METDKYELQQWLQVEKDLEIQIEYLQGDERMVEAIGKALEHAADRVATYKMHLHISRT